MACINCNMNNKIHSQSVQLLILALTGQCNLNCSYCYASNQIQQSMPWSIAEQALQYITEYSGTPTIQFTGGEPLLAWDLLVKCVEWLEYHKFKAKLQIQTNATLLDEQKIDFIKKYQIGIGVSLDGFADSNAINRPYKDFSDSTTDTIKGIQLLSSAGIEIGITTVVNTITVERLDKVIDLAFYLGNVRQVGFNLVRPQGRGKEELLINEEMLEAGIHKMLSRLEYWQNITNRSLIISQLDKISKLQKGYTPFSHCDAIICLTDDDKLNLLVALLGKHLGVPKTIVRVGRPEYIVLMEQVGIDIVFSPRLLTSGEILRMVRRGENVVSISTFEGSKAEAVEVVLSPVSPLVGCALKDLKLPGKALVGAVVRDGSTIVPTGNTVLFANDHIVFFTLPNHVNKLLTYLKPV